MRRRRYRAGNQSAISIFKEETTEGENTVHKCNF